MKRTTEVTPSAVLPLPRIKLLPASIALVAASVVLLAYQAITLRATLAEDVDMQAEMVADNVSASMMFDDEHTASEILRTLCKVPYVESADVYTSEGKRFASCAKPGLNERELKEGTLANASAAQSRLSLRDVFVARPISQAGKSLGSVVLVARTDAILVQLIRYAGFLAAASLGAIWIAFALTARLDARVAAAEKELEYLASTDPLTGLPNRRAFYEELDRRLRRSIGGPLRIALVLVDLDDFQSVNDTLGHGAGDELLKHVAAALRRSVRATDVVCRIGGDEFAVVVDIAAGKLEAHATAERIAQALARPFALSRTSVAATASVGMSVFPDDASDVASLVSSADIALHAAKSKGKNSAVEFHPAMTVETRKRVRLEMELRKAIETNAFELAYQPQFDCRGGMLVGAEALLRWVHPTDGPISPVDFIPIAEDSGLIVALGQWVLRRACQDAARWNAQSSASIPVAVNVSAHQLRHPRFTDDVRTVLEQSGLAAGLLEIELTESQLMANIEAGVEAMRRLRAAGVRLALDDFGTGYSSLSYLQSFPVNSLKIDRRFVRTLPDSGQPIATAIISMAHSFDIAVVAEGVEMPEQLEWLVEAGCDVVQGFLTGRPMPFEQFADVVRNEPLAERHARTSLDILEQ